MSFVLDIWYFAGLRSDVKSGSMIRREIACHPITLGARNDGTLFALRDICPHRAALLSAGKITPQDNVECPYHGWTFSTHDGTCQSIPALTQDQQIDTQKIKVRNYHVKDVSGLIWVYIPSDENQNEAPDCDPPVIEFIKNRAVLDDEIELSCHVDHAVIGLMDPAHGPFVHQQWWWRTKASIHEKSKAFVPSKHGFTMSAHTPSSNSFAYKLLGGEPVTEIRFTLPGIRTETITIGKKTLLSLTAVTPIDDKRSHIRQMFFTDIWIFKILSPVLGHFARQFLRQDAKMVELQQEGLKYAPKLMLIEDADMQAKWYFRLKKEWDLSRKEKRAFINPVKARTLFWRS